MIITIDGPAGSGKSTISKEVANRLNFKFFDTGAIYRAVTWFILKNNCKDDEEIKKILKNFSFDVQTDPDGNKRYFVNKQDITTEIRKNNINKKVSEIASKGYIREKILTIQRDFSKNQNAIFEGRDMSTVVFPNADIKFFLTANIKVRAKRRFKELHKIDPKISYEEVLNDLKKRDIIDSTRKYSPLKCPKDAISIDTSFLSFDKVVKKILKKIKKIDTPQFFKMKPFYGFILFIVWVIFKTLYRLKVYKSKKIPKGSAIIASNHLSYYDPIAIAASFPEEVYYLAKKSLFKKFFLGSLITKLNALPISQNIPNIYSIKTIIKILKKGKKVILFPEGKRSKDGEIQKIMPGIGYLVYLSKCLIIPTYIHGTQKIWGRNKKFPKLYGKISCVFGSPISPDFEFINKKDFINKITNKLEQSLKNLKKWCDEGFKGVPP